MSSPLLHPVPLEEHGGERVAGCAVNIKRTIAAGRLSTSLQRQHQHRGVRYGRKYLTAEVDSFSKIVLVMIEQTGVISPEIISMEQEVNVILDEEE